MSKEEILQVLQAELPKLIRDDPLFRAQVVGVLTESLASREEFNRLLGEIRSSREQSDARFEKFQQEMKQLREESTARFETVQEELRKQREETNRRFEEQREETNQRFAEQREETSKRFEAMDRRFEAILEEMRSMRHTLDNLGRRWGIQSEESVRKFAQEFIATEFGLEAKKWKKGQSEIDIVVRNGNHFAIEIKSTVNHQEVEKFAEHLLSYQQETGIEPKRKIIVTAHGTSDAYKKAADLGIEIIGG